MPFRAADPDPAMPSPGPLHDRRVWVRYPGPRHADAQVFDTRACSSQFARVVNLSAGGIGLLLDEPVPRQTFLKVEIEHQGSFHMLVARVVHVTAQGGGWLHGCEFTRPLSPGELRDLLEG